MLLRGKSAAATGGGSGIGSDSVSSWRRKGPRRAVNDLGTAVDGVGESRSAADQTVEMIKQAAGQATPTMTGLRRRGPGQKYDPSAVNATERSTFWCMSPGFYVTA